MPDVWLPSVVGERSHAPSLRHGRLVARCSRRVELWPEPDPFAVPCRACQLILEGRWGTARRTEP